MAYLPCSFRFMWSVPFLQPLHEIGKLYFAYISDTYPILLNSLATTFRFFRSLNNSIRSKKYIDFYKEL